MKRALGPCLSVALVLACTDQSPTSLPPFGPSAAIQDATHNTGNPDFFFLPPMVPNPSGDPNFEPAEFNPNLGPAVSICELAESDPGQINLTTPCSDPQPAGFPLVFTMTSGPGGETVKLGDQHYHLNWHAMDFNLATNRFYRVQVSVGSTQLGFADVDVVNTGKDLRNVQTGEFIGLVNNRTLPVKFRIENSALCFDPETGVIRDPCTSATIDTNEEARLELASPETGELLAAVDIPTQGGSVPDEVTVTLEPCEDIHVDLPLFGNCLRILTDPPVPVLETPAIISICNVDFHSGLTDEQERLVTLIHQSEDRTLTEALPHAEERCVQTVGMLDQNPVIRFAQNGWLRVRKAVRLVSPTPLWASATLLDRGGGGEADGFGSFFQFALPAKMDYVDPDDADRSSSSEPSAELATAVLVTDARDMPVSGARVTFTVTEGNGQVGSDVFSVVTGSNGIAQVTWTLDADPTINALQASGRGIATPTDNGPLGQDGEGDAFFDPYWPDFLEDPPISTTPVPFPSSPGVVGFLARIIPPSLTLVKIVVNNNGGTTVASAFTLTATGPTPISGAGGATSDAGFWAGTYTLSETGPSGYATTGWTCAGGTQVGSQVTLHWGGETATCSTTNDDVAPSLTLVKTVVNDNGGTAVAAAFTLKADGPTPLSGAGGATSGPSFSAGIYTLSESGPSGYSASAWTCVGGTVSGNVIALALGQTVTCTIVNDDLGQVSVLIVAADDSPPQTQLMATGRFSRVDYFNAISGTPTLATLTGYQVVLAYSNFVPQSATALGNVLADYVDGGGGVVLSTYAFSTPWSIMGRINTAGYSPLLNVGQNGDVSGALAPVVPGDPVFASVNLGTLTYFHNSNFARPAVAAGATLVATDGAGRNMIARNSSMKVVGLNLFPGTCCGGNNAEFFKLLANALVSVR